VPEEVCEPPGELAIEFADDRGLGKPERGGSDERGKSSGERRRP
jgi:hypothetical protein